MWRERVGVLLVSDHDTVQGILSERDFIKAIMDDTVANATVKSFMTPIQDLVTVLPDTGMGHCMDLMRSAGIRHLPVVLPENAATMEASLMKTVDIASQRVSKCRDTFQSMSATIQDVFGDEEGEKVIQMVLENPHTVATNDGRRAVQTLGTAALRMQDAIQQHAEDGKALLAFQHDAVDVADIDNHVHEIKTHQVVGMISIKDMLLTLTNQQVLPALEWLNEERLQDIADRGGYSE